MVVVASLSLTVTVAWPAVAGAVDTPPAVPDSIPAVVPTLPPTCTPPAAPSVVFVGRLDAAAAGVGRFTVEAVRSDLEGMLTAGTQADVRLGADLRFLVYGNRYLVAAEHTADNALRSKVRAPLRMFGTDQVAGVNDFGTRCPSLSDPIILRNGDGSAIDTGVLRGLLDDRRGVARSLLLPLLWVGAGLVALWALKRILVAAYRSVNRAVYGS